MGRIQFLQQNSPEYASRKFKRKNAYQLNSFCFKIQEIIALIK